jgi:hypothetical protein
MRRAVARAICTAGNKSAIRTPMIAITTKSSTSVKAGRLGLIELLQTLHRRSKEFDRGSTAVAYFRSRT